MATAPQSRLIDSIDRLCPVNRHQRFFPNRLYSVVYGAANRVVHANRTDNSASIGTFEAVTRPGSRAFATVGDTARPMRRPIGWNSGVDSAYHAGSVQFKSADRGLRFAPFSRFFSQRVGAVVMPCRGVRGATLVERNEREAILAANRQLLALMIRRNGIDSRDVASAIFTTTFDLDAEFPALAARQLGWLDVPLLCGHEIAVPGSLARCARVLVHWNTDKPQGEIHHVYIHGAEQLRPDIANLPPVDWAELEAWIAQQMGGRGA